MYEINIILITEIEWVCLLINVCGSGSKCKHNDSISSLLFSNKLCISIVVKKNIFVILFKIDFNTPKDAYF